MSRYPHLFSPCRIGTLELKNRIAMAPMGVEIVQADGQVGGPAVAYYAERARGGAGLLITENTAAAYPVGANTRHEIGVSDDAFIPGLRRLADAAHEFDAKIAIQLAHHGKVARVDAAEGRELLMPSQPRFHGAMTMLQDLTPEEITWIAGAMGPMASAKVREATKEDIEWLIETFASAALRAQEAGIDAVELHAAHGYIFSEFLSPAWNFREDEYGGSPENRARLLTETLRAVKRRVGANYPVWCRIDAMEYRTEGGTTPELAERTAELAVEAGADAVHVSAYADATNGAAFTEGPLVHEEGGYVEFAAAVKRRVSVPVIAVGRIEPQQADALIRDGQADLVSMGRKMLADPAIAQKLEEGREAEIRPCVYCYTCVAQPFFDKTVRCAVNPVVAKELARADLERTPAQTKKRVLVVGGGTAGLEAARVAALRGHEVLLCEKGRQLGGTLRFAALVYEPNERLLRWLTREVERLGVEIRLETPVDAAFVADSSVDVVIVAVGAQRQSPAIPGIERDLVLDGDDLRSLLTGEGDGAGSKLSFTGRLAARAARTVGISADPAKLREASRLYLPLGDEIVVLGGGLVGLELAEFLMARGRNVTILEEGESLGVGLAHPRRWRVLEGLREGGSDLRKGCEIVAIEASAVRFREGGREQSVRADNVILASGLTANRSLAEALAGHSAEVVEVGDGTGVGYIEGAIHDAFRAASDL